MDETRTRVWLVLRNRFYSVLASRAFSGIFEWLLTSAASDFALPNNGSLAVV